jgi:ATP-dependent RNA helicase SUPV3L1/SUV3
MPAPLSSLPTQHNDRNASLITALLGPTNTGKTTQAIERMVAHGEGMIGLPLRLLAREVYERVCALVDPAAVALITGEERIEPPGARFWVCTVEAMPVQRDVAFVAVDEIQLATHPERGHVFTDRLLNLRGTRETWFLGSDNMAGIVEQLVPTAQIEALARLSALRYVEPRRLGALPHRSAVIAFSASHVYELAERLRQSHGGAAVVLGSLSPQTRNAQVQMFESGQVQHLVSTDAIGMGLNLDISYVYFGALRKFDGLQLRELEPWELGQIAGRAGRGRRDGFFGLTEECAEALRPNARLIEAVQSQQFAPVRRVWYRNSDLDFSSTAALREGLRKPPFTFCLEPAASLLDERALEGLLREPALAKAADASPERVALLWEVCQVPDFRGSSEGAHVRLLARIFGQLVGPSGRVSPQWMERQMQHLEEMQGGLDAMTQRLAWNRTWAYVAHREGWLAQAEAWRARTRALEEELSEALHASLTAQFVEERAPAASLRPQPHGVALEGDAVVTRTIPLGRASDFSFYANPEAVSLFGHKVVRRQGQQAAQGRANEEARALLAQEAPALEIDDALQLRWGARALGQLERGASLLEPTLRAAPMGLLEEGPRAQVQELARRWLREACRGLQAALEAPPEASSPARGVLYQVSARLGVLPRAEVEGLLAELSEADRLALARAHVRVGWRYVYALPMLKPGMQGLRGALWALWQGLERRPALPGGAVSVALDCSDDFAEALGWPRLGPRCVRVDMAERVAAHLRKAVRRGPTPLPAEPMQWLGCPPEVWAQIFEAFGYRLRAEGAFPPRRR